MRSWLFGSTALALLAAAPSAMATPIPMDPVGGFYSDDDHFSHAVVATTDGWVRELYWDGGTEVLLPPGTSPSPSVVPLFHYTQPIRAISAHYSTYDGFRRVTAALADGTVHEVKWKATAAPVDRVLFAIPSAYGPVAQIASYATRDGFDHAVVQTADDSIYQYRYTSSPSCVSGCGTFRLYVDGSKGTLSLPFRTTAFTDVQEYEHVAFGFTTGSGASLTPYLRNIAFAGLGASTTYALPAVANIGTFVQIAGYVNGPGYVDNFGNTYLHTIVGGQHDPTSGDLIEEYAFTPQAGGTTTDCEGGSVPGGIEGIAAFADKHTSPWTKHVIVADKTGEIWDYWRDTAKSIHGNFFFRAMPLGRY